MSKNSFQKEYTIVQVIQIRKNKKTSIVQNSKGEYFIAKKFYMTDIYALNQIGLMKTIKHPNVVAFHDLIMEKSSIYLIEEYCQEGDLSFHIRRHIRKKKNYFSENIISKWLLQLLLALQYLHNKKIMHRDIKPQNIFLTSQGNLKLGSFRSSKLFASDGDLAETALSSQYYMAPQCLQNYGYDEKVDIWAFGFIIYELCSLKSMFEDNNYMEQVNVILKGHNKPIPSVYSKQLENIYCKCLSRNPKERPSARALLRQPYFIQKIKKMVSQKNEIHRIPIKHYKIHLNNLADKKQKDIITIKQKYSKKQTEINQKNYQHLQLPLLPKIQQKQKDSNSDRQRKNSKEEPKSKILAPKQKQSSVEKKRDGSKEIIRKKSVSKIQKSSIQMKNDKNEEKKEKSVQKRKSIQSKEKLERLITEQNAEKTKKLVPPPILPRPPAKKIQKKDSNQKVAQQKGELKTQFSDTMKSSELSQGLSHISKSSDAKKFNIEEVQKSLVKVFQDLNIQEDDEQQFSFELEDENLARLTTKKNEGNQLLQTYQTKLYQLIEEINNKYCPQMESIQERTQQFDSNTFANVKSNQTP